ncbi:MAG: hypothetical protein SF123_02440 [Chloroflexota bacterium]|nr:hypothetical protein [Chloroflexota bacterium]
MPVETPLQVDMFTGAMVDTRTSAQKQRDAALVIPRQMEMFSQREFAQYIPPSKMSLPDTATLMLVMEDPRTDEERERDRERAARELTRSLFADDIEAPPNTDDGDEEVVPDAIEAAHDDPEERKRAAQLELEKVISDITQTIAATPDVLRSQSMWLALATVEAHTAGLDSATLIAMLKRLEGNAPKIAIIEPRRSAQSYPEEVPSSYTPPHVPFPMSFI